MMASLDSHSKTHKRLLKASQGSFRLFTRISVVESLNYHEAQLPDADGVSVHHRRIKAGNAAVRALFSICTAALVALCALFLSYCTELLLAVRNNLLRFVANAGGMLCCVGTLLVISVTLVAVAASLVQWVAPTAAGAGVSLIMAYLNGNDVPHVLQLRTMLVKLVGCVLTVGAQMTVGPEGPMVHIGACSAAVVARALTGTANWMLSVCHWWEQRIESRRVQQQEEEGSSDGDSEEDEESLLHTVQKGGHQAQMPLQSVVYVSNVELRDMVAAGAAAGMAAAFGAPIGGLLFAVEEARSHWSRHLAGMCLLTAGVTSWLSGLLQPRLIPGILSFPVSPVSPTPWQWVKQLPSIALVSALCALLGIAFNAARHRLWANRATESKLLRVVQACRVAAVCVLLMSGLSAFFGQCRQTPQEWIETSYGIGLDCPMGSHNDVATALFSSHDATIRHIFKLATYVPHKPSPLLGSGGLLQHKAAASNASVDADGGSSRSLHCALAEERGISLSEGQPTALSSNAIPGAAVWTPHEQYSGQRGSGVASVSAAFVEDDPSPGGGSGATGWSAIPFSPRALGLIGAVYCVTMVLCVGMAAPGGMFMPAVMVGAAFGTLYGLAVCSPEPGMHHDTWPPPSVYAVAGATATLSALFRSYVSVMVLMLEATRAMSYHTAVVLSVIVANCVASLVHQDGMYEIDLEHNKTVAYLPSIPPPSLQKVPVTQVMTSPVLSLNLVERVSRVLDLLQGTRHNAFAVLGTPTTRGRPLAGIITRKQLYGLFKAKAYCDAQGHYLQPHSRLDPEGYHRQLSRELSDESEWSTPDKEVSFLRRVIVEAITTSAIASAVASSTNVPTIAEEEEEEAKSSRSGGHEGGEGLLQLQRHTPLASSSWHDSAGSDMEASAGLPSDAHCQQGGVASPVWHNPEQHLQPHMSLGPFMRSDLATLRSSCSALQAYRMLISLDLRHLFVVDQDGLAVGVVTRKDLRTVVAHADGGKHVRKVGQE